MEPSLSGEFIVESQQAIEVLLMNRVRIHAVSGMKGEEVQPGELSRSVEFDFP
jgi:hypothetical protein